MKKPLLSLLLILTICYGVGFLGSQATMQGLPVWYMGLEKPSWTPPPWLFAPVWTVLYGLMGFAAWQVWRAEARVARTQALVLFVLQLLLNGLWPWVFFGMRQMGAGAIVIGLLWLVLIPTIYAFWKVRASAGILLLPYLGWITFAGLLNLAIWRLNG